MSALLAVACCLAPVALGEAQSQSEPPHRESESEAAVRDTTVAGRFGLTVAYFGETITHPGLAVAGEAYLVENRWYKLIAAPQVGFYMHPHSHGAAFLELGLGNRATTRVGFYADIFLGAGYLHTWPWGDVYRRDRSGEVRRVRSPGFPHVKFDGAWGVGWDFSKNDLAPVSVFARWVMFGEYPFNTVTALHGAMMVGATWRFGQRAGDAR
ncbi:MAG: hypothetical protein KUG77_24595 [Nannocystaceae bacterium]|nr:hypothetical protein [Nannocystaceae bacterium]